jgi:hypothetical protein
MTLLFILAPTAVVGKAYLCGSWRKSAADKIPNEIKAL